MEEEDFLYEYEVVFVGDEHVDVIYRSEGNPDIFMGVHRPYEDEDWDAVIEMYAPIQEWANRKKVRKEITVGEKGQKIRRVPVQRVIPDVPTPNQ